jgi:indole-3-glycerol phosphate synthase
MQVVETKEAGASGVLGVVTQVSGQGTPVLSAFAATLGMDAPIEVVNQMELDYLVEKGVPIVAMACSIGLSATLPGYSRDVSKGLLQHVPPQCASLVGVSDIESAREAAQRGASALLVKASMLEGVCDDAVACKELVNELKYQISGDD